MLEGQTDLKSVDPETGRPGSSPGAGTTSRGVLLVLFMVVEQLKGDEMLPTYRH